jgi:hypothetical protein
MNLRSRIHGRCQVVVLLDVTRCYVVLAKKSWVICNFIAWWQERTSHDVFPWVTISSWIKSLPVNEWVYSCELPYPVELNHLPLPEWDCSCDVLSPFEVSHLQPIKLFFRSSLAQFCGLLSWPCHVFHPNLSPRGLQTSQFIPTLSFNSDLEIKYWN